MRHEELDLEKRCRELARRAGWVAVKLEKNGHKGIPDDLFIKNEFLFFLVEFKKDCHQRRRPEQDVWANRFPRIVKLISSEEEFRTLLNP